MTTQCGLPLRYSYFWHIEVNYSSPFPAIQASLSQLVYPRQVLQFLKVTRGIWTLTKRYHEPLLYQLSYSHRRERRIRTFNIVLLMQSKIIAVSVFAKTTSLRALPLSYFPHSGTPLLGCPQSHGFYISIPMFAAIPSIDFRTPIHRLEPAMVSSRIRTYTFLSMSDDLSY